MELIVRMVDRNEKLTCDSFGIYLTGHGPCAVYSV